MNKMFKVLMNGAHLSEDSLVFFRNCPQNVEYQHLNVEIKPRTRMCNHTSSFYCDTETVKQLQKKIKKIIGFTAYFSNISVDGGHVTSTDSADMLKKIKLKKKTKPSKNKIQIIKT